MQLLFDFFPIVVFFVAYKLYGIYPATGAIIAAMAAQIAIQWVLKRKISKMLLISGAAVAVLGGITLAVRDPLFLQWKLTVVNWLFAVAFLGSAYIGEKTLTERAIGHAVELPAVMWRQLNLMWVANFAVLGAVNLFVVYRFDEATWVNFKFFGVLGFSLLTAIGQALWISARVSHDKTDSQGERPRG